MLLTAHYGNHEKLGQVLARSGVPLLASYREQKPACFDRFLLRLRSVDGVPYAANLPPREILRQIQKGRLFALLADQDFRRPSAVMDTFLGLPVRCNPLPAFVLRHLPGTPVFFAHLGAGGLVVEKWNGAGSVYAAYHRWLEALIRQDPHRWYGWLHRRWLFC